ncbi:NAD(P)-dependent oxidoreductase [Paenibacillus psychroresistens]|uniref:NAD(P)-dependent oxidoreductase n=1 Tax=Paenibacillus psychroresistens TaxID=1778678 RepID=A0A6B8RN33_9BACL|nr:NAD(P)-dependent oxidoreductase [Paenibacillus psychroresistens]QGQ97174.1 NAD(P)-dependent oxidoreductase [Paenibacillus psychroresistens]
MNIMVTGATGRIGSRLIARLLERGHYIHLLVRQPEKAVHLKGQGVELIAGDLLIPDSYEAKLANIDAIIHLAAFFRGATPEETQAVNLEGTKSLASLALKAGVKRFVMASTNLVYGPGREVPFDEQDTLNPQAPYPATKAAAEAELMELHSNQGLGLRILRFAFVYGENDPHLKEGLAWFRNWNPQQQIHIVHHADVAQAIILAVETDGIDGQIYNVADDAPVAAIEIMELFDEKFADDAMTRAIAPAWLQIVNTKKIQTQLGFAPHFPSLQHAVKEGVL